jgi:hypothetical protein
VQHLSACALRGREAKTLYLAMRAGSRAVWTTIKNSIDGIEDEVKQFKQNYQAQK